MSISKDRVLTLKALIAGSAACTAMPVAKAITEEIDALYNARLVRPRPRRSLLEVLHAARALDSCLSAINAHYSCSGNCKGMGDYLRALRDHTHATLGKLHEHQRSRFHHSVVRKRNRFLHAADTYPTVHEVNHIVSEAQECFVAAIGLE
jgi:hypothetical protein